MSSEFNAVLGTRVAITYSLREALEVVLGYAFGTHLPTPYTVLNPRLYAYRSYDSALRTTDTTVCEDDVFASVGLNSGITAGVILRILAVLDHVSPLPDLSRVPDLWHLDVTRLNADPGPDFPEHELWRWHHLLTSIDGVGGAVAAKVVHHRHPRVMPLWDSFIARAYHSGDGWGEIGQDLRDNAEWFDALEQSFSQYRVAHQGGVGVDLARLRLLDILVWGDRANFRGHLAGLGRALLDGLAPDEW